MSVHYLFRVKDSEYEEKLKGVEEVEEVEELKGRMGDKERSDEVPRSGKG